MLIRLKADMRFMEQEILSVLSVILFCLCSHQLIKAVVTPIPLLVTEREFALAAMKISKFYKITAWAVMTCVLLMGLIYSFQQVFTTL